GATAGGPGGPGGTRPAFDPSMLKDPEVIKRMKEDPRVQAIMKQQGVDDPSKIDWTKVQRPGGGAGGPMGGGAPMGGGGPMGGGRPMPRLITPGGFAANPSPAA